MRSIIAILALLFSNFLYVQSQEKFNPYNAEKIISQGVELHDKGEYEKALELYNSVNRNDSSYLWALAEKTFTLTMLKRYDDVIKTCRLALSIEKPKEPMIYMNLASALDELDQKDSALKVYDEALKIFPMNSLLCYNKAITLQRLNRIDEAVEYYEKALIINPNHRSSHLRLGYIFADRGLYAQSMLSFFTFILISPTDSISLEVLSYLDKMFSQKSALHDVTSDDQTYPDAFSDINMLIKNRLAMNSQYQLRVKTDFPVVRQTQLLLENLKLQTMSKDFFMQLYGPFYSGIISSGNFEGFIYEILSSSPNQDISKTVSKNGSKIKDFNKWAGDAWNSSHNEIYCNLLGKNQRERIWRSNNSMDALGYKNDGNMKTGPWIYFYNNGCISAIGSYSGDKKSGHWLYYYPNGGVSSDVAYKNGNFDGLDKEYSFEGYLTKQTPYTDSLINGTQIDFYNSGDTMAITPYLRGLQQGRHKTFYPNIRVEYDMTMKNDKIDGLAKKFHENGALAITINFKDGKKDGTYHEYYDNGQLLNAESYLDGNSVDSVKYFYRNGVLKSAGFTSNNYYVGNYNTYYHNGQPEYSYVYNDQGKLNGPYRYFDIDGKLMSEVEYKNDIAESIKCFNKKGEVIYSDKQTKNVLHYKTFYSNEVVESEGNYVNGKQNGEWHYYNANGILVRKDYYKDDSQEGETTVYNEDGSVSKKYQLQNNELHGAYNQYYTNGAPSLNASFYRGKRAGEWTWYQPDGTISTRYYYLDGEEQGWQEEYDVNGKLERETLKEYGKWIKENIYDTLGNVMETIALKGQSGKYLSHYMNDSVRFKCTYKNGVMDGECIKYYPNGKIYYQGAYLDNKAQGKWMDYNYDGKLTGIDFYDNGDPDSVWTDYFASGKVETVKKYLDGKLNGAYTEYFANGKEDTKGAYWDDERNGKFDYYCETGDLMYSFVFCHDKIIGYISPAKPNDTVSLTKGNGLVQCRYSNGKLSLECKFVNGLIDGAFKTYYPDGKKNNELLYKNGLLNGTSTYFYSNEKIKSTEQYSDGDLHGLCSYYSSAGTLTKSLNYKFGKLHGWSHYYNDKGILTKSIYFYNDNAIREEK